jgi:hypothetical protein
MVESADSALIGDVARESLCSTPMAGGPGYRCHPSQPSLGGCSVDNPYSMTARIAGRRLSEPGRRRRPRSSLDDAVDEANTSCRSTEGSAKTSSVAGKCRETPADRLGRSASLRRRLHVAAGAIHPAAGSRAKEAA